LASVVVLDRPDLHWSTGAPLPFVVATEQRTLFAFERPDATTQTAEFVGCTLVKFGFPNDEVQHGLAFWELGLKHYAVHEILDSPWLNELRTVEAAHSAAPAVAFAESRHFVLTFHDSTLEAIARDIVPLERYERTHDALEAMAAVARTTL
jgi:hypothetical protein